MKRILILEDNPAVQEKIEKAAEETEKKTGNQIDATIIDKGGEALDFLAGGNEKEQFDMIFLDFNSPDGVSFYESLPLLPVERVISISNIESANWEVVGKGALGSVQKDYANLEKFKEDIKQFIEEI
ncbi:MAG: hypothetical protein U5L10_01240 [Candidatus Moranbacteria bacterium]|nr:hypothetical protein [Candidatus Moranbacteria bacterium]